MILGIFTIFAITIVILALLVSVYVAVFKGGPFVPTPMAAVHKVLKSAGIKKGDIVYDIGAGDGRFVHFATKDYHAKATGFEIDPFIYTLAKIRKYFWRWKGQVRRADFTKHDISNADIILCYMLPRTLKKFQPKFDRELKKGAKVVSYAFHIGDWKPKKIIPRQNGLSRILIYQVS